MKTIILVSICLFLVVIPAHADSFMDDWDQLDRLLLATYTTTWFIDWGQTREIAVNDMYYETNAFLGEHPSKDTVDIYFIGMYFMNLFIADNLGSDLRKAYLLLWTTVHYECVENNRKLGISMNFNF